MKNSWSSRLVPSKDDVPTRRSCSDSCSCCNPPASAPNQPMTSLLHGNSDDVTDTCPSSLTAVAMATWQIGQPTLCYYYNFLQAHLFLWSGTWSVCIYCFHRCQPQFRRPSQIMPFCRSTKSKCFQSGNSRHIRVERTTDGWTETETTMNSISN